MDNNETLNKKEQDTNESLLLWDKNDTRAVISSLFFILIWLSFQELFIGWFDKYIVGKILSKTTDSIFLFWFVLVALLGISIFGLSNYKKYKTFIPYRYLIFGTVFILLYGFYRFQPKYVYSSGYCGLGVLDLLVLFSILFVIHALVLNGGRRIDNSKKEGFSFYSDKPLSKENEEDILGFRLTVSEFFQTLRNTMIEYKCGLSIGLTGVWGEGKSSFMYLLKECFDCRKEEYIVIDFNPRYAKSIEHIQFEFFQTLYEELKKYDIRFSSSFSNYLKAIQVVDKTSVVDFVVESHNMFFAKDFEKEKINKAIQRINKKIVVFIDDFDRLLPLEIIEVCKLIDGNASFDNMYFISAYDKDYVNLVLKKDVEFGKSPFIDKFFTIEKQLPFVGKTAYTSFLMNELKRLFGDDELIDAKIQSVVGPALIVLSTLRDCKRFLNRFVDEYRLKKEGVEFKDFFILLLIEYRWKRYYEAIRDGEIVKSIGLFHPSTDEKLDINTIYPKLESFEKESETDNKEIEFIDEGFKDLFKLLFENNIRSELSINNKYTFDNYFKSYVNEYANPFIIEKMFVSSIKENKRRIDDIFEKKQTGYLIAYLSEKRIELLKDTDALFNYIDALFYTFLKSNDWNIGERLVELMKIVVVQNMIKINLIGNQFEYKEYLSQSLKGEYPDYPFLFNGDLLIAFIRNTEESKEYVFAHEELLAINRSILKDLIQNEFLFNQKHIEVLYKCVASIEDSKKITIHLDKEACSLVRKLIEENPEEYLRTFVRFQEVSSFPERSWITCEPFWFQIFAGEMDSNDTKKVGTTFKTFLFSNRLNHFDNIQMIRNFWELYENNNYQAIQFEGQGNVQEKIDRGLVEEKEMLNQLLLVNKAVEELIDGEKTIKILKKLEKQLLSIYLNLALKVEIYQKIQKEIDEIKEGRINVIKPRLKDTSIGFGSSPYKFDFGEIVINIYKSVDRKVRFEGVGLMLSAKVEDTKDIYEVEDIQYYLFQEGTVQKAMKNDIVVFKKEDCYVIIKVTDITDSGGKWTDEIIEFEYVVLNETELW
ncbi:hypothetical protein HX004_12065 [Myroides sp. 1354]|uniref:P-loop NTPase fold protein n=1 Tax=unclassified Myroides TaxID=2642485 RepID=UPI002575C610|nr:MULTISPECIES: P-loop NTPase fold protein [unclassified Myroides]MDM1045506.1 hypothetical protein [Myroides sp. R163-1]MDM1056508.1 hypothetical protein [Myroides sp. 1354]MDM1069622.1 hypothetical protein [Myroides sp. 1372]